MTLLRLGLAAWLMVLPTAVRLAAAQAVLETFESAPDSWQVVRDAANGGAVERSTTRAASGLASARLVTTGSGSRAAVRRDDFSDAALAHVWEERPGTYRWQRARFYLPAATVAGLGGGGFVTIARFWASAQPGSGWAVRVRAGGALSVVGTRTPTAPRSSSRSTPRCRSMSGSNSRLDCTPRPARA